MMHNTCSPAAPPDKRGMAQPNFSLKTGARKPLYFEGNDEPSLDEMMDDDVVRRVMARDGVHRDQLMSLMDFMRNRLR